MHRRGLFAAVLVAVLLPAATGCEKPPSALMESGTAVLTTTSYLTATKATTATTETSASSPTVKDTTAPGTEKTTKTTAKTTVATTTHGTVTEPDAESGRDKLYQQNKSIAMPQRNAALRTVTLFSWQAPDSDNGSSARKPNMQEVYEDAGLTVNRYAADQESYIETLAALVATGRSPDLFEWDTQATYPAAIASHLVMPMDDFVDFSDPLWADAATLTARYRINGKTYFSVEYTQIDQLLYYDPAIMREAGLETPLELWRKGDWTLKRLQSIADRTCLSDKDGTPIRIGFIPDGKSVIFDQEPVELDETDTPRLTIGNQTYKYMLSIMYQMGTNGTGSAVLADPAAVGTGGAVMAMAGGEKLPQELADARRNGRLEWCILPKIYPHSEHCYNLKVHLTYGMVKGSKNPQGAAYVIELRKWAHLNYPLTDSLPFTDTSYTRRYGGTDSLLTEAQQQYTRELLSQDYAAVAVNLWQGWVGDDDPPCLREVLEGTPWYDVLPAKKAELEDALARWSFG